MAPPPSTLSLQDRLLHLAQTLQFGWFVGHLTLLFCAFRYGLSWITLNYYSRWAQFSYRTAFVAAAFTYGIVVYKSVRARTRGRQQINALTFAGDENVQYLAMALVWLFSSQVPLALLPFMVYSVFHVATYTRTNLIPTIQPPTATSTTTSPGGKPGPARSSSALGDTIGKFVKEYYDASMTLVASLEILLWFRILGSAILFTKGSWTLLVIYTVFFRARYSQSSFVQGAITNGSEKVDAMLANQSTPPQVRQAWDTVKGLARQAADATDVNRYVQGGQQVPKKAQ